MRAWAASAAWAPGHRPGAQAALDATSQGWTLKAVLRSRVPPWPQP